MSDRSSEHARGWAERATEALYGRGQRRGGAREALVGLLADQGCALSMEEIRRGLEDRGREVSRASGYRIIDELEAACLLRRVDLGAGPARYEAIDREAGHHHHHHLLCERCGALEPFTDAALERAIAGLGDRLATQVSEHEVVIRGACHACAPR